MNKKQMITDAEKLFITDREILLNRIIKMGYKISECADGSRINLDRFPETHLEELSKIIKILSVIPEKNRI